MSDLAALAADLQRAGATAAVAIRPALIEAGKNMKKDWQSVFPWSGSRHLPHLGGLIRNETTTSAFGSEAQAWVEKTGQGNLAHLIEYGGPYNGPHPGGAPALAKAAPLLAAEMAVIASSLL